MDEFLEAAYEQALMGLEEGGIPIGSVLVKDGKVIGAGHNRRVQEGSVIRHAEMDCLERAGRLTGAEYRNCVLYSTLSPCDMCSGAVLLYGIPKVVVGENVNFQGPQEHLISEGVDVKVMNDPKCIELMRKFIRENPTLWDEDIGI